MKINELPTPCYVIDEGKLEENLKILSRVEKETGAKILLAQKCFSAFCEYPLIAKYISGTTASGLYEAKLGYEEMGKENHVFSPAYRPQDMDELCRICDHIIFNSKTQLMKYCPQVRATENADGKRPQIGIRINPECSTQEEHEIYDPCAKGSRMGVRRCDLDDEILDVIDGIHFHTLCEQNSDALEVTLGAVEEKFGDVLHKVKWINMGGGHHITRDDYDIDRLIRLINHIRQTYDVEVYLEPGEAVALNAGYNVTTVLDIVDNDIKILILDTSAACHMPDV
ncbi:MAG: carboxynorspermidine decarboxylase, partial [Lachnospiraceae bacterium]|nr:carboxynorspermidine decarboxylase [Lachnospiraceae bacterium]